MFNPAMAYDDEDTFVDYLLADQPEPPRYFSVMKRVNKEGPRLLQTIPSPSHLPAARLPQILESGAQVVDTRLAGSFAERFVPGTINIPAHELSNWAGWLVDFERPLYLIVDSYDSQRVVRDLHYIGVDNIAGYFETTAVQTLAEMGHQLRAYDVENPEGLAGKILNGEVLVVDIRNQTEWDEGHIPGAQHVMLGYLADRSKEIINGQPIVVQCRSGNRSAIGASVLLAQGAKDVINMQGGLRDWANAGLPIEK
jgi:hydroxyacylglutathione hydrolase